MLPRLAPLSVTPVVSRLGDVPAECSEVMSSGSGPPRTAVSSASIAASCSVPMGTPMRLPRPNGVASAQKIGLNSAGGDQVALAGFLGDRDGDGADQRGGGGEEGDPQQSIAGGGSGDEGGGDEWGEAATEGGGQLIAQDAPV